MKCNTNCNIFKEGKSRAGIHVGGKDVDYCVYRHSLMLKRGEYERVILVSGDITSTFCYKERIVKKRGSGGNKKGGSKKRNSGISVV